MTKTQNDTKRTKITNSQNYFTLKIYDKTLSQQRAGYPTRFYSKGNQKVVNASTFQYII